MSKQMCIVFTGKLKETRNQLKTEVESYGHIWKDRVGRDTDLLVVGYRNQSLVDRGYGKESKKELLAKTHGCKIVRVTTIEDMIEYFV